MKKKKTEQVSDNDNISLKNPIKFFNNIEKASPKQICAVVMIAVVLIFMAFGFVMLSAAFSFRGYLYVETTYKIELSIDSRNCVTDVRYMGEDSVRAFKSVKLTGLSSSAALEKIFSIEIESRRLNESDLSSSVFLSVNNKNPKYTISDLNNYISYINKYLNGRKITVYVNTDCFTDEEKEKALEYKISPERYRLMEKTASLVGDYDIKQLLDFSFEEGVKVYNELYKQKYLAV